MRFLRLVRALLILALLGAGAAAAALLLEPRPLVIPMQAAARPPGSWGRPVRLGEFDSARALLVAAALFHPERLAQPLGDSMPPPGGPNVARPALKLTAIAWGAVPAAVIEGFPGAEQGRVVVRGDTAGGLTVQTIRRDAVVIVGLDTTWVLALPEGQR